MRGGDKMGEKTPEKKGIFPVKKLPGGGDIHEHVITDKEGKIRKGTTTVRLPKGKEKHLPWKK